MRWAVELAPCLGSIAGKFVGWAQQQGRYIEARIGELPSGHETISAVVTRSAQDCNPLRARKRLAREISDGGGCGSHQVEGRDSEALACDAVAGLHLGGREDVHCIHGSARQRAVISEQLNLPAH
jgi:hypothetical protein